MSLLEISNLSKNFGGLRALDSVNLSVQKGSIHGLMGANGAGKTTLFSIIAGNQRPSSGSIVFQSGRIDGMRPDKICRTGISRTFQIVRPFPRLSVRENVETAALFGRAQPPKQHELDQIVGDILSECHLADRAGQLAATLTLAGLKRLEVARALATEPTLLMLDEVMAGLTPTEVEDMITTLLALKERMKLTILIIEHVMSALNRVSDEITVLHHGRRIASGKPAEISSNNLVTEAYFGSKDDDQESPQ
jgi:branched-chain amino acid transport system ATP-binding protein